MRYVRFELYPPDGGVHPVDVELARSPSVAREAIVHLDSFGDGTAVLLYHVTGDPTALTQTVESLESVHRWEHFSPDGETYCYLHVKGCGVGAELLEIVREHALIVETPLEFCGSDMLRVTVAGQQRGLHHAFEDLGAVVDYEVTSTGTYDPTDSGVITELTPRQRTVLRTATELGYYAVPKRATHEDIAAQLGCATSTVDEHLRKAESRVFSAVIR